jgi:hypothetical protein
MFSALDKLIKSTTTLILLGVILIPYIIYYAVPTKHVVKILPKGNKTVEEIIQGSYTSNYKQDNTEWDSTFNSRITPIEEK